MLSLSPKTLSSYPFLPKTLTPKPQNPSPQNACPKWAIYCKSEQRTERNLEFDIGDTFFRHESATGRDLAVLAASIYKTSKGNLRVLDAMCGCGVRSLRYLVESEANFVLANDANENYCGVIMSNLSQVPRVSGEERRWLVTHSDANRIMTEYYLQKDFFDLIDVDSFGSDSTYLRSAFNALKLGGLIYITSTDGYTSGGHRPQHCLDSYGAYIRPMPYSNEIGLRMVISGAVREASVLGYHVVPLFSYYSYHGPVFRIMLRVNRGKHPSGRGNYGFICYCVQCGHSQTIPWSKLGRIHCPCNTNIPGSLVVSGPLWTGPLHSAPYLTEMLNLAQEWGWTGNDMGKDLEKLLRQMIDESDPKLPFGYIKLDEISGRGKFNTPPLSTIISAMHKEGYAASRSHIASNAIKTNCPMAGCIRIAKELQQC
ncbi:hypothetical protein LguiA_023855 [Lonicera macranthoides]